MLDDITVLDTPEIVSGDPAEARRRFSPAGVADAPLAETANPARRKVA